ncbi:MAG TPA: Do family serine endopeptidase [Anaeromyxobacter sp.]|nr:Do family serine endopeptidase [Anaeromyxobacter sp.]
MRRTLGRTLIATAAVTALGATQPRAEPPAPPAPAEALVPSGASLAPLVERLRPSVVNISTVTAARSSSRRAPQKRPKADPFDDLFERFFGARPGPAPDLPEGLQGASLGSGFLIDAQGFVLTNNHVVKDATEIRVRLTDGRDFQAKVVGRDPLTDVALLQLEDPPRDLPPAARLGDSDALRPGDFVLAMGSPFGLRDSVTLGIVSAKHRAGINAADSYDDYIQTDAAINPGNSGGPLFNLRGEVVGINTLIVSPQMGQGIGFAIPISMTRALLPQLREKGRVVRGFLGVTVSDVDPEVAEHFRLAPGTKGAFVQTVQPRSPADRAGVRPYDIITQFEGRAVDSSGALTRAAGLVPPGQTATLTLLRGGEQRQLTVKLAPRPEDEAAAAREKPEREAAEKEAPPTPGLGLALARITPEIRSQFALDGDQGLVVMRVIPDGPADRANLRRGDVVLELNQQPIRKIEDVTSILSRLRENEVVLLRVQRGGAASILTLRVGAKR